MSNNFEKMFISQTVILVTGSLTYLVGKAWNTQMNKMFQKFFKNEDGLKYTLFITMIAILLIAFLKQLENNIHYSGLKEQESK